MEQEHSGVAQGVRNLLDTCKAIARHLSDTCKTIVRHLSDACKTIVIICEGDPQSIKV